MNPQDEIALIEEVIQKILNSIQQVIQSGEELPDELQGLIAEELKWASNRILELQQGSPVEALNKVPQLDQGPYPSSQINSFKYDYPNKKLFVKFQGKDTADSGPVYSYENVPPFIYDTFRKGAVPPKTSGSNKWHTWKKDVMPSLGAAMNHLIKTSYPYQRVG